MWTEREFFFQIRNYIDTNARLFWNRQITILKFRNMVYHITLAKFHTTACQVIYRSGYWCVEAANGFGYSVIAILSVAAANCSTAFVITGLHGLWGTRLL